jgi:hypothetical protein
MNDCKQVSGALVKAQRDFGPALKDKTNPAFRSKYADLGACIDAVIEALNANGIALIQRTLPCESGVTVETVFVHESGESLSCGPLHVPAAKQDPQGYGSALTYARRYSLMSACGIAPEDDDGNAGSKRPDPKPEQKPNPKADKPAIDMSPKARASRIAVGVAAGDATGAAESMASMDEQTLNAIWAHLDEKTQAKLTAAWPKVAA